MCIPKIYKNTQFIKWQRKIQLSDSMLKKAVEEIENGLFDAQLGSNLFKKELLNKVWINVELIVL